MNAHRHRSPHTGGLRTALMVGMAVLIAGCATPHPGTGTTVHAPSPADVPSPQSRTIAAFHTSGYQPQQMDEQYSDEELNPDEIPF